MAEESKLAEKLEEKTSEKKFTEDELKIVAEIKNTYGEVEYQFGQLEISKIKFDQQFNDLQDYQKELTDKFIDNQEKESQFLDDINNKYGAGQLDLDTGVFIPDETPNK